MIFMREYMSSLFNSSVMVSERRGWKSYEQERMGVRWGGASMETERVWKYYIIVVLSVL